MGVSALTLSNADKLRFAEVEDRITREFGDSDTMDFLEYLKQQDVENDLRQDSLEESIEFLVNECGELQKEVNEYRQQEETKLTETLDLTQLTARIQGWAVDRNLHTADPVKQALKFFEEAGELSQGMVKGNEEQIKDSIGDIYVVMTILSMQLGLEIEDCVYHAYDEIKDRRGKLVDGVFIKESDL